MFVAWLTGREPIRKKCKVSFAVLKLQSQLVAFGRKSLRLSFCLRQGTLHVVDTPLESFDPATRPTTRPSLALDFPCSESARPEQVVQRANRS